MKIHRCAATARDGEDDEGCGVRTFHWLEFLSSRCRRRWRCSRSRSRPKRLVVTSCCHRQWSLSSSLPWPGVEVCASTKCPYSAFAFPLSMCPNVRMMIEVSMYTQLFVSRMKPVVDAAPETLLFRTARLRIIILWNQPIDSVMSGE